MIAALKELASALTSLIYLRYNSVMIFDGREFAREIEEQVKIEAAKLPKKPVILSILVGNDPASELYTSLKKKAAERVGIKYRVERLSKAEEIESLIKKTQDDVDGIMIQLPIPGLSREEQDQIVKLIPPVKDVDGLRWEESRVTPATVKAVLLILEKIKKEEKDFWAKKFLVVGGTGVVGRPLVYYLRRDYGVVAEIANSQTTKLRGLVEKAEVVISCVGRAGLITKEMVDTNKIVIDVGISMHEGKVAGDMERDVYEVTKIAVPVPGGVGPVTVASLMLNTWGICAKRNDKDTLIW